MEELCHYPGKGGQAWQGHGPSVGGGGLTIALGTEGTQRGDVTVALRTDEMRLGGLRWLFGGQRGYSSSVRDAMVTLETRVGAVGECDGGSGDAGDTARGCGGGFGDSRDRAGRCDGGFGDRVEV